MSIILRTNKGQALTYDEMDRNLSQFYYSSSVAPDGTKIRLHFSGSDNLDLATEDYGPTRYHEIQFPSTDITIPDAIAAGDNTQIQFNDNGAFGADSVFVFEKGKNYLGLATSDPTDRLDIHGDGHKGASISLRGQSSGVGEFGHAKLNFFNGSTFIGRIGRTDTDNQNIYITNNYEIPIQIGGARGGEYGKVHVSIGEKEEDDSRVVGTFWKKSGILRFGIGTKIPNRQGTFVGANGIGISLSSVETDQSFITPIPDGIYNSKNANNQHDLIPNSSTSAGLLISSPKDANGGNIVVAINTDGLQNEGFNIINASLGTYDNSEVIFSAQASGKVGINTNFPSDTGLTVAGNISGSGTLQVETIDLGTANNTSALVATSTGLVQKIAAAPVPLGGIIMWSGTIANIPSGWRLCETGVGAVNGITIPDLTDKFIMGAGDTFNPGDTGGSNTHNHGGNTQNTTLTLSQIPSHDHVNDSYLNGRFRYLAGWSRSSVATGVPSGWETVTADDSNDGGSPEMLIDADNTGLVNSTAIQPEGGGQSHKHGIDSASNIPEFYALAYIIYVGV